MLIDLILSFRNQKANEMMMDNEGDSGQYINRERNKHIDE